MIGTSRRWQVGVMLGMAWLSTLLGCHQPLQLPAIDPTGQRIFLPAPASTRLATWSDTQCRPFGGLPEPAWQPPVTPPPCPEPPPATPPGVTAPVAPQQPLPAAGGSSGVPGQLTVTPQRILAPVGSEVVLVAGLCGPDGYLVANEPVEWMLSQDSVGQIVDYSEREVLWHRSKKLSADYAVTRTARRPGVVTRGTPSVTDDLVQQKGQCWISVSSQTEGSSILTVVAPQAANWPQRRESATIYWVDAQWALPTPATVPMGQPHVLTTTISRTATAAPVAGWLVRYEVVGGVPATFGPGGTPAIEIPSDGQGRAAAPLQPTGTDPGTTQVRIQIIRPADPQGDAPQTQLGEGYTTVTWSAPGLALRAAGPATGAVDATLVYRVEVYNPGDITTRGVVLRDVLPPNWRYVSSRPSAQVFGDRAEWQLGDIGPKATQGIEINVRPEAGGNVRYRFQASSADGLAGEAYVDTQVIQPSLGLSVSGPPTANVGDEVQFRIQVTNSGPQPLGDVTITDRFDQGLEHAEGQASPIVRSLGRLEAGETRQLAVTFFVRRSGQICHTLEVTAPGGQFAQQQVCLDASPPRIEPRPAFRVTKSSPPEVRVGEQFLFTIQVTNTGNVPLTGVQIVDSYDTALQPTRASRGWDQEALQQGQIIWNVDRLEPAATIDLQVLCVAREVAATATNPVVVTTLENVRQTAEGAIRVLPADSAPPPSGDQPSRPGSGPPPGGVRPPSAPGGPAIPVSGQLKMDISEFGDPVVVGERTTYLITIVNDRTMSDRNVTLTLQFPPGLKFQKLTGPVGILRTSPDGSTVEVTPIKEIRAGEQLQPFQVEAIGQQAGEHELIVRVSSDRTARELSFRESTTVTGS